SESLVILIGPELRQTEPHVGYKVDLFFIPCKFSGRQTLLFLGAEVFRLNTRHKTANRVIIRNDVEKVGCVEIACLLYALNFHWRSNNAERAIARKQRFKFFLNNASLCFVRYNEKDFFIADFYGDVNAG